MDCRQFHERHAPFVDLMCSAVDEYEMREHMRECAACSRHDTRIRRSLLLVRNLPTIEPSPDFRARLDAKLRAAAMMPRERDLPAPMRLNLGAFAAVAAGIAFVTYIATDVVRRSGPASIEMPPVVATLPQPELSHAAPAMVAAVPTGMSVWPAIVYASQAQMQLVAAELASER